jgi:transposase
MEPKTVRTCLSDEIWEKLKPLIKEAKHSAAGKPATQQEREFMEGLLWLARTGSPWRDLPPELGRWHSVYMRYRRWESRGVWRRLWSKLQQPEMEQAREVFIDSTTVRAHQHAAGAPKKTVAMWPWVAHAEV